MNAENEYGVGLVFMAFACHVDWEALWIALLLSSITERKLGKNWLI